MDDRLRVSVLELGRVLQELEARVREQDSREQGLESVRGDDVGRRRRRRRRGRGAGRGGRGAAAGVASAAPVAAASAAPAAPPAPAALPPEDVKHPRLGARREAPVRLDPPPQRALRHGRAARAGGDEPGEERVGEDGGEVEDVAHQVLEGRDREPACFFFFYLVWLVFLFFWFEGGQKRKKKEMRVRKRGSER